MMKRNLNVDLVIVNIIMYYDTTQRFKNQLQTRKYFGRLLGRFPDGVVGVMAAQAKI